MPIITAGLPGQRTRRGSLRHHPERRHALAVLPPRPNFRDTTLTRTPESDLAALRVRRAVQLRLTLGLGAAAATAVGLYGLLGPGGPPLGGLAVQTLLFVTAGALTRRF